MKKFTMRFAAAFAIGAIVAAAGCRTVDERAVAPADPRPAPIMAREPQPAPIPQKPIPAGESSLKHTGPDQRIDRP